MCLATKKQEEGENASLVRYDLNGQCRPPPTGTGPRVPGSRLQPGGRWCFVGARWEMLSYAFFPSLCSQSSFALRSNHAAAGKWPGGRALPFPGRRHLQSKHPPSPVPDRPREGAACAALHPAGPSKRAGWVPCFTPPLHMEVPVSRTARVGGTPIPSARRSVSVWAEKAQTPPLDTQSPQSGAGVRPCRPPAALTGRQPWGGAGVCSPVPRDDSRVLSWQHFSVSGEQKEGAVVPVRCSDPSLPGIAFLCHVACVPRRLAVTFSALTPVVPSPTFQVVSSQPYVGDCRGPAALRLLNALHYSVHPALDQLWSKRVPLLVEHIEGRKGLLLGRNSAGVTFSKLHWGCPRVGWATAPTPRYAGALQKCHFLFL